MEMCREHGVVKFERTDVGGVSMVFGPPPPSKEEMKADPQARKRRHYVDLLGRHVTDEELKHLPDGG